ncbi:MAG: DinB family protein [Sphingobacteriia bacterium]|jgi:hypothetical protein
MYPSPITNAAAWMLLLEAEMRKHVAEAKANFGTLTTEQLYGHYQDGKWSLAELLCHMTRAGEAWLPRLEQAIKHSKPVEKPLRGHRHSRAGGRLLAQLQSEKPLKAPRPLHPKQGLAQLPDRDTLLKNFCKTQLSIADLMAGAIMLDLQHTHLRLPTSRLLRYNLGDAFAIHTYHVRRHLKQAYEGIRMPDFPHPEHEPAS